MPGLRSRRNNGETESSPAVLALDDFVPLLGAISLLPIIINASSQIRLSQATILEATAVTSGTLTTVCLFIVAVSSVQTADYGRFIALSVAVPILLLIIAGLPTMVFNTLGAFIAMIAATAIDILAE